MKLNIDNVNVDNVRTPQRMLWSSQTVDKVPVFAGTFTMSTVFLV